MSWNGSDLSHQRPVGGASVRRPTRRPRVLFLALVILLLGAALALFLHLHLSPSPSSPASPANHEPSRIATTTPTLAPTNRPVQVEKPVDDERARIRARVKNMTPEERKAFAFEMMKKRELDLTPTTNRPFRTETELQLARICMTEVGEAPPPRIPGVPQQELAKFTEILMADNPVLETDSEEWRTAKDAVQMAKKELVQFIKDGGTPDEFINYYQGVLENAFEKRRMTMREFVKTAQAEPELANELYHAYNKQLEKDGIKKMVFPDKFKEKVGIQD